MYFNQIFCSRSSVLPTQAIFSTFMISYSMWIVLFTIQEWISQLFWRTITVAYMHTRCSLSWNNAAFMSFGFNFSVQFKCVLTKCSCLNTSAFLNPNDVNNSSSKPIKPRVDAINAVWDSFLLMLLLIRDYCLVIIGQSFLLYLCGWSS